MLTKYDFTYDNNPAHLMFSEATGELSEIEYIDREVRTKLIIQEFGFNEQALKINVYGTIQGLYSDNQNAFGPNEFTVDATSQESLSYFESFTYNYPLIKRQMVNGVAFEFLGMILFNPDTGAFEPVVVPPVTPIEP